MSTRGMAILVVTTISAASGMRAQTPQTLDLATAKASDTTIVPEGSYLIRVASKLPKAQYVVTTAWVRLEVPPIGATGRAAGEPAECNEFAGAVDNLANATKEEDLPALLSRARAVQADSSKCPGTFSRFGEATRHTTDSVATYALHKGEYVRVDVRRLAQGALAERHWQWIISTGPAGEWQITYGFSIPVYWGGQERFSARQTAVADDFVITRDSPRHFVDVVPSVFFSWMTPSGALAPAGRLSLTAGLGADLTNPSVFLGLAWTWKRNLQVAAGASLRQEPVLLGKYRVDDVVHSSLTSDQLTEKVYRVQPFIAITLRLSKDPFGSFGWLGGGKEATPTSGPKDGSAPKPSQ